MVVEVCLENETLWKMLSVGKYGEKDGSWCSKESTDGFGVGLERPSKFIINGHTSFIVGKGKRVKF